MRLTPSIEKKLGNTKNQLPCYVYLSAKDMLARKWHHETIVYTAGVKSMKSK